MCVGKKELWLNMDVVHAQAQHDMTVDNTRDLVLQPWVIRIDHLLSGKGMFVSLHVLYKKTLAISEKHAVSDELKQQELCHRCKYTVSSVLLPCHSCSAICCGIRRMI